MMKSLKRSRLEAGLDSQQCHGEEHLHLDSDDDSLPLDDNSSHGSRSDTPQPKTGKKTRGRVKISMEFIDNKLRRYTTFSKRKSGIMKKAHELATLTGTQVMLLVASETGHVYTFATRKLQPILSSEAGKQLIQTCLNSPDPSDTSHVNPSTHDEQRMSAHGFEEPELSYVPEDSKEVVLAQKTYHILNSISTQQTTHSPTPPVQQHSAIPMNLVAMSNAESSNKQTTVHLPSAPSLTFMQASHATPLQHQQIQLSSSPPNVSMHMLPMPPDMSPNSQHSHHQKNFHDKSEESRLAFLNSYTSLQRTNMQPFLVADHRGLQMQPSQLAVSNQSNVKKPSR